MTLISLETFILPLTITQLRWTNTHSTFIIFTNYLFLFPLRYLVQQTYAASNYHSNRMEDVPEPFKSMNHAERMMKKIEGYASKRQLCDIVIIAGNKRIPGHRLVLSAASDYFAAMFTNDVKEAKMEEIVMKDVDPESMEAIVNYAYTGKIWMM